MHVNIELKCPKCDSDRVGAMIRTDDYDRHWIYPQCFACGHKLSFEEVGQQVTRQIAQPPTDAVLDFPEGGG